MKIDTWQLFIDESHSRNQGEYYDGSEAVARQKEAACAPTHVPVGPWEPLGNGEWRRPLRFKTAKDEVKS